MDIRDYKVAIRLINEIESEQFENRRIEEYKAYKVSEGGQRPYILERLQLLFPKSYATMRVSDISVSNKVLSKISKAYKDSPKRVYGDQSEDLDNILGDANFDRVMSEFDRDYNRQRYALLWVNQIDGMPSFHSLKGFESFVKKNQKSGKIEVVILNYPDTKITANTFSDSDYKEQLLQDTQDDTSAESKVYAMWTSQFHAVWKMTENVTTMGSRRSIEMIEIEGNPNNVNDLGMLPFVYISKNSSPDLPFLNQLTEQSITYNVLNSDLLTACALQGYGQLVVTLHEDQSMDTLHSGMTTAIHLPIVQGADSQSDAKYINPNPDLSGMMSTIQDYGREILDEHGISTQSSGNGNSAFSSGLERLIANADVSDKIKQNQIIYAQVEEKVIDILTAYGFLRESEEPYSVIYEKPKVMISDAETLSNIEKRLNLGLITKIEALQIIDPNLSDEAAADKIEEIKLEKQANIAAFMGGDNASNIGRNKLSDESDGEVEETTEE